MPRVSTGTGRSAAGPRLGSDARAAEVAAIASGYGLGCPSPSASSSVAWVATSWSRPVSARARRILPSEQTMARLAALGSAVLRYVDQSAQRVGVDVGDAAQVDHHPGRLLLEESEQSAPGREAAGDVDLAARVSDDDAVRRAQHADAIACVPSPARSHARSLLTEGYPGIERPGCIAVDVRRPGGLPSYPGRELSCLIQPRPQSVLRRLVDAQHAVQADQLRKLRQVMVRGQDGGEADARLARCGGRSAAAPEGPPSPCSEHVLPARTALRRSAVDLLGRSWLSCSMRIARRSSREYP